MKKAVCILICLFLLSNVFVSAQTEYEKEYNTFVGDKTDALLTPEIKSFLYDNGIDPSNEKWVNNIDAENVFSYIISLFKGGLKKPLKTFLVLVSICLLLSLFSNFFENYGINTSSVAATLCTVSVLSPVLWESVVYGVDCVKMCAVFMSGFVPVFAIVTAASGKALTAASMSGLIILSADFVSYTAGYFVLPLTGGYFAVSICSAVSPILKNTDMASLIKKVSLWVLSLVSTVFLGILSIQTIVNTASDNVALKTAKFILGTSVPVAGSALSEAVTGVAASVSLLQSSVGIYAVVVLLVITLPIIINLILWRFFLNLATALSQIFSSISVSSILKAADGVCTVVLSAVLLTLFVFVISLAVVIKAGG